MLGAVGDRPGTRGLPTSLRSAVDRARSLRIRARRAPFRAASRNRGRVSRIDPVGSLPDCSHVLGRVRQVSARAAAIAMGIAEVTRLVPAPVAGRFARLSPLGWYAVAAIDPFDAGDPLARSTLSESCNRGPSGRLGSRSSLHYEASRSAMAVASVGVATTIANLNLPHHLAVDLVAHRDLFAVVQLAVFEAESDVGSLGLTLGAQPRRTCSITFGWMKRQSGDIRSFRPQGPRRNDLSFDRNPHQVPLVQNLLRLAGESRRRNGPALVARLEGRIDVLHRVVKDLGERVGERLRDAKLAGLAELGGRSRARDQQPARHYLQQCPADAPLGIRPGPHRVASGHHPTGEPDCGTTPRSHALRPSADAESACVRCVRINEADWR